MVFVTGSNYEIVDAIQCLPVSQPEMVFRTYQMMIIRAINRPSPEDITRHGRANIDLQCTIDHVVFLFSVAQFSTPAFDIGSHSSAGSSPSCSFFLAITMPYSVSQR